MKNCCCASRSAKEQSKPELASAPSTIYPLEPEKPGKFIMITGKPGMGKSTTALFLAQKFGFKYYEADCLLLGKNPYIPLDSKQIETAIYKQRDMKFSKADTKEMRGMHQDGYFGFNRVLARHILQERHRHGGDFVVAWSQAHNKEKRDAIRKIVGPELIFVVLTTVDQSLLLKRCQERSENIYYLLYGKKPTPLSIPDGLVFERDEPINERKDDEYKVVNIEITDGMKVEDVANKIIELIEYI